jgi:hypothetical protein
MKITNTKTIILTMKELKEAISCHIRDIHSDKLAHYINTNDCRFSFTGNNEDIKLIISVDGDTENE